VSASKKKLVSHVKFSTSLTAPVTHDYMYIKAYRRCLTRALLAMALSFPRDGTASDHRWKFAQQGRIVVLNGLPGVGNLTVTRHPIEQLEGVGSKITRPIDNHLLTDSVHALFPDRSPAEYHL